MNQKESERESISSVEIYNSYILNDENMRYYLKYNLLVDGHSNSNSHTNTNSNKNPLTRLPAQEDFYIPKHLDSLFWCYYILKEGETEYELLPNKNALVSKQMKIQYVQRLRDNKPILKTYKFDTLSNLESNLANDNILDIKTMMSLCVIDNINVVFLRKNTYFEVLTNDSGIVYVVQEYDNKYHGVYGICFGERAKALHQEIRTSFYRMESLAKPVKAVSAYKVHELKEICTKLGMTDVSGKTKTELYETILHYF
jgi:hypothetical protein